MQRGRGAVIADIGGRLSLGGERIEAGEIRALVDKAAFLQHVEEIGLKNAHLSATLIILVLRYLQQIAGTP
jgi:hypothetical protein